MVGAAAFAALLASAAAPALAALPLIPALPLGSLLPTGPTWVVGYEVGSSEAGIAFAGGAAGALRGSWTAQVETAALPAVGPAPASLVVQKGTLTLVALGVPLTIAIAPTTANVSDAATTTAQGPGAGAGSTAAAAAAGTTAPPAPIVPTSLGAAEEMLQVLSATDRAAKGATVTQTALAGEAGALLKAYPSLAVLGAFPLPATALTTLPRVLTPPDANGCGDTDYPVTMRLSLATVAKGTFTGDVIFYRAETAAGCATYGASISGQISVSAA